MILSADEKCELVNELVEMIHAFGVRHGLSPDACCTIVAIARYQVLLDLEAVRDALRAGELDQLREQFDLDLR